MAIAVALVLLHVLVEVVEGFELVAGTIGFLAEYINFHIAATSRKLANYMCMYHKTDNCKQ